MNFRTYNSNISITKHLKVEEISYEYKISLMSKTHKQNYQDEYLYFSNFMIHFTLISLVLLYIQFKFYCYFYILS